MSAHDEIARAQGLCPNAVTPPVLQRLQWRLAWLVALAALAGMVSGLDVSPEIFSKGLGSLLHFLQAMSAPTAAGLEHRVFGALAATFGMAILATTAAAIVAFPLGIFGARTIVRQPIIHFVLRRLLDLFRGVPVLVWALILVSALGLGPLPGILALILADIPNMAKLYAEAIENVEEQQRESVRASGASERLCLRFGILPQVAPVITSQTLYFLESNFRNAAILGIVGAGGIGHELEERIRIFAFGQVAYILILFILCVMILDTISAALRRRLLS